MSPLPKLRAQTPNVSYWLVRAAMAIALVCAIALLAVLVWSTGKPTFFAGLYDKLMVLNGILAIALVSLVVILAVRLLRQIRRRQFGARLTARFTAYFTLIGILPGVLIYALSVQFMSRSMESWFNVRVDSALEAGRGLGHAALDAQLNELSNQANSISLRLNNASDSEISVLITTLRASFGVDELMVFSGSGRLIAFSSADYGLALPDLPPANVMNQLRIAHGYAAAENAGAAIDGPANPGLHLRVIIPLGNGLDRIGQTISLSSDSRWLQLVQAVPERIAQNINQVQQGFNDYQELAKERENLHELYGVTLTLALILVVFASTVAALAVSRRLVQPLLTLASGTQAVGVGDYRPLPELPANDEVGQLTRSFNTMTRQLEEARVTVDRHRKQLEQSKLYLETVLSNLSSGVLVFDKTFCLNMFNQGAQNILHADLRSCQGRPLETIDAVLPFAQMIRQAFAAHDAVESTRPYWQQQFEIELQEAPDNERKKHVITIFARGSLLQLGEQQDGFLVVFDDISEVISASRTVAWGEVARRLAHEIKNPLTPIQLSAERLALKLAGHLQEHEANILQRSTQTIVNQVASLKQMVDDFRDYARTPPAQMQPVKLNDLLTEVLTLYGWDPDQDQGALIGGVSFQARLANALPDIMGDPAQLRQVIHNLLTNARDAALQSAASPEVRVQTRLIQSEVATDPVHVCLTVSDNGTGFAQELLNRVFEPYVTTKATGTGLGLAIVKKIAEEHQAKIDISNRIDGGARISILFSLLATTTGKRA